MLRPYNFIFYVIYNSYYKHGNYKNDNPPFTVFFIFALTFFCQLLFLVEFYRYVQDPYIRSIGSKSIEPFLALLSLISTYLVFYLNRRYEVIYNEHKDDLLANSFLGKFIGWSALIFFILSPFLLTLIRNKIYFDAWT